MQNPESSDEQRTDGWSICLTSEGIAYVRGNIYLERTADALIEALQTIEPLIPRVKDREVDGDWAE